MSRGKVTSKYVEDNASMAKFLLSSRVKRIPLAVGREIAAQARANALAAGAVDEGDFVNAFEAESQVMSRTYGPSGTPLEIEGGPRWGAIVRNSDPGAAANEFGNRNIPERRPLRDAAEPYHVPRIIDGGLP